MESASTASTATNTNELDALAGEAAYVDAAAQPQALPSPDAAQSVEQPAAPRLSHIEEAGKIVDLIAWAVEKIFPVLGYREETKKEAAAKLAPLMEKYNITDTVLGKWGAEIEAGMFFGGLVYASIQAVKTAKETAKEPEKDSWFAKFFRWGK